MTDITMPTITAMPASTLPPSNLPPRSPRVADFAPKPKAIPGTGSTLPETIAAILTENADLKTERDTLKSRLAAAEAAISMLESNVTVTESRVVSYQAERDKVVADYGVLKGKYETLFHAVKQLLDAFVPPAEPVAISEPQHG